MDVRLLGPLAAFRDGERLALGGVQQRAVLALLALNVGRTVGREQLIDEIWGEGPPESAAKMVQIHVSALRKILPGGVLQTHGAGYSLELPADSVDLHRFLRLAAEGRSALANGDPHAAAEHLREALALWRGPALAEFTQPFAQLEARRLYDMRLSALEDRLAADLELGRHAEVVAELEALVAREPLRERLREQHMIALFRCGRQAEALAAYRQAERALREELGLQPSARLRALEQQILAQDAALLAAGEHPGRQSSAPEPEPARLPQQIRFCRSGDGTRLAWASYGEGPPLVKAGNWLTHLEGDLESPVWRHWIEALAARNRLIRYDDRGSGLSDRTLGELSLDEWVADLAAVVDDAELERFPLLAVSGGGPVAVAYAARHPERVSRLVLYGSYVRGRERRGPTEALEAELLVNLIRVGWGKGTTAFRRVFANLFVPDATPEQMDWFDELQRLTTTAENAVAIRVARARVDASEEAAQVRCPTLVVNARDDAMAPFEEGRRLASLIPGARFVPLEGRNHILLETEPAWPEFLRELRAFLEADVPAEA